MSAIDRLRRMRHTSPLIFIAALFVVAGGFIHLREWLDVYRSVPADAPGAALVRIGFPVNAAVSLLVGVALIVTIWRQTRFAPHVVIAAIALQAASLAALIATRTGSLLGWAEPIWTPGANQTRAVEVGALLCLTAVAVIAVLEHLNQTRQRPAVVRATNRP